MAEKTIEKKAKPEVHGLEKYLQNPVKNAFYINTLKEIGITFQQLEFKCKREGIPTVGYYMIPDEKGNIRFYTPDIYGDIEFYSTDAKNSKIHDWYLTRFANPEENKNGAKYMPVRGSNTRLLITPAVYESFHSKIEVDTLYLIEGFKKALSFWASSGLPIVGMNGLTGFKEPEKDRLRPELRDFITTCKVKKVVIIDDSDLFDLSTAKDKPETLRPNNFYRATLLAKSLFEPFCDVVLVHPTPNPEKKIGFDDLLLINRENEVSTDDLKLKKLKADKGPARVFKALQQSIIEGKTDLFKSLRLSSVSDYKIRQYFHLDDVMSFYSFYIDTLKERKRFKFYTQQYEIKPDGTLEEVKEEEKFGFIVKDNCISKKKKGEIVPVSNFIIRVLFHIKGDDTKRVVELTNYLNQKAIVEFSSTDFNNPQKFNSICMDEGDFIFKGGKDELLDIASLLFKHEKPAICFPRLGYQPRYKVFAFANGIVTPEGWRQCDEYGIVDYNDTFFYFPAYSKFNTNKDDNFEEERKYSHFQTSKNFTFNAWKKQFSKVYGNNGEIAAAFYLAALFSDIVFTHKASGIGFPLLWSAGKPKTGKSTICSSLLNLFGEGIGGDSLSGSSTIKYKNARFSQICNALIHLDEYQANDKRTQDFLKNIYDRMGYGTKTFTNDSKTRMNPILSAALISGEVLPTDNHALFTRSLLMIFNKTEDQRTDEEREEFRVLSRMEENGLTGITVEILMHRSLIETHFDEAYKQTIEAINTRLKANLIDGRMKKNAAAILAVSKVLIDNTEIDFSITFDELISIWCDNLKMQDRQIKSNTDTAKFWDIVETLYRNRDISEETGDFLLKNGFLIVRLNRLVPAYTKEAYIQRMTKVMDKASIKNYLENEPYYCDIRERSGAAKKIRFKDSNNPTEALWLNYSMIVEMFNIDLTRTDDPSTTEQDFPTLTGEYKSTDDQTENQTKIDFTEEETPDDLPY